MRRKRSDQISKQKSALFGRALLNIELGETEGTSGGGARKTGRRLLNMRGQDSLEAVQTFVHQRSPGAGAGEAESGPAATGRCLVFLAGAFTGSWSGSVQPDFPRRGA